MLNEKLPKVVTALPGPNAKAILDRRAEALPDGMKATFPVVIENGEGALLEDVDGNYFLDWIGGVGVLNIGYTHPEVVEAVKAQSDKYFHAMMAAITHEGYIALCEKLNAIVPVAGDQHKSMLVNCGAEAIENAVKIAKGHTGRPNVIVFSGAFHGRTSLTMEMTADKKYAVGMGPFPEGIYRAEFPNVYRKLAGMTDEEAIAHSIQSIKDVFYEGTPAKSVAAIVVEPIQGEGGFVPAPIEWAKQLRKICDEEGIMLIADEVQCGFGRSGHLFASEYWKDAGCAPDILACAKSIGAGLPLGAVISSKEIMDSVPPATIGGTFCGNAVACAAALKVIEVMERDDLPGRAKVIGDKIASALTELQKDIPQIGDVRGLGSMLGIEFVKDPETKEPFPELTSAVIKESLANGLLVEPAGRYGNVIRFLAPLVMTDEQLEAGLNILIDAIKKEVK
ncbi:MAG: aspartate aminotransferase family protein [Bacillota bacterium]|nr:aspartate aminotransferase family protein [Bacillota bacterium]